MSFWNAFSLLCALGSIILAVLAIAITVRR